MSDLNANNTDVGGGARNFSTSNNLRILSSIYSGISSVFSGAIKCVWESTSLLYNRAVEGISGFCRKSASNDDQEVTSAENEDLTPENVDLTAENEDLTPENEDLTAENEDLTPENEDLAAENEDLTAENENLTAENVDNLDPENILCDYQHRFDDAKTNEMQEKVLKEFTKFVIASIDKLKSSDIRYYYHRLFELAKTNKMQKQVLEEFTEFAIANIGKLDATDIFYYYQCLFESAETDKMRKKVLEKSTKFVIASIDKLKSSDIRYYYHRLFDFAKTDDMRKKVLEEFTELAIASIGKLDAADIFYYYQCLFDSAETDDMRKKVLEKFTELAIASIGKLDSADIFCRYQCLFKSAKTDVMQEKVLEEFTKFAIAKNGNLDATCILRLYKDLFKSAKTDVMQEKVLEGLIKFIIAKNGNLDATCILYLYKDLFKSAKTDVMRKKVLEGLMEFATKASPNSNSNEIIKAYIFAHANANANVQQAIVEALQQFIAANPPNLGPNQVVEAYEIMFIHAVNDAMRQAIWKAFQTFVNSKPDNLDPNRVVEAYADMFKHTDKGMCPTIWEAFQTFVNSKPDNLDPNRVVEAYMNMFLFAVNATMQQAIWVAFHKFVDSKPDKLDPNEVVAAYADMFKRAANNDVQQAIVEALRQFITANFNKLDPNKVVKAYGIIFPFAEAKEQQKILENIVNMIRPNIRTLEPKQLANFLSVLSEVIKKMKNGAKGEGISGILEQLQSRNIPSMLLDELKTSLFVKKIKNEEINNQIKDLLDNLNGFQEKIDKMGEGNEKKKATAGEVMAVISKAILSIVDKSKSTDADMLARQLKRVFVGTMEAVASFDDCIDAALMGLAKVRFFAKLIDLGDNPPLQKIINVVADECSRNVITEFLLKISEILAELGVSAYAYERTEILEGELLLYLIHDVLNAEFVGSKSPVGMMTFIRIALEAFEHTQTCIEDNFELFKEKLKLNCSIDELREKFAVELAKIKVAFGELTGRYEGQYDFTRIETVILLLLAYRSEEVMTDLVGGKQFSDVIEPEIEKLRPTISNAKLTDTMNAIKRIVTSVEIFKNKTNDDKLTKEIDNTISAINNLKLNENSSTKDLEKAIQETYSLLTDQQLIDYGCHLSNPDFNLDACGIDQNDLDVLPSLMKINAFDQRVRAGLSANYVHDYVQGVVM